MLEDLKLKDHLVIPERYNKEMKQFEQTNNELLRKILKKLQEDREDYKNNYYTDS